LADLAKQVVARAKPGVAPPVKQAVLVALAVATLEATLAVIPPVVARARVAAQHSLARHQQFLVACHGSVLIF
jgi:hypothetical protein